MKTQVNLQMTLTKEETIGLQAIFVKRADILNDNRIETGYHWKSKVTLNTAFITETMSLTTKQ